MSEPSHLAETVLWFATQPDFEAWLEEHHERDAGAWLAIAKKNSSQPTLTYADAIETALCFGWIDGQKQRGDDEHWLQRFTPRSRRSRWSQVNRQKAEDLIAAGRMRPSGLVKVEAARADGRWNVAYAGQRKADVPPDLQHELDIDPCVAAAFIGLDSHNRFAIIWRLNDARRPETRARRLAKYVDMLRRGDRLHG